MSADEPHQIRHGDVAKGVDVFQGEPEAEPVLEVGKRQKKRERVKPEVARKNVALEDVPDIDAGVGANDRSDGRASRASGHRLHIRVSSLGINKKGHRLSGAPELMLEVSVD